THALDVDRSLQSRQQFANVQRIGFVGRVASLRGGRTYLTQQGGRRHLAAGHAVDGVVDEDDGDGFAAIGRVQNLRRTDRGKIPVALIADDNTFGPGSLDGGGYSRSPPMRRLDVADIEVIVGEDRTAHRTDQDGPVLH